MAANGFLARSGIIGWDKIEPALLAAVAAEESVLFVGSHGANKTEGSEIIAKAVLGKDAIFRKYDTPLLNLEDVMGFPDPKSIAEGQLRFIQTQLSIWTPDAILLDEINRASLFLASKLMEIIRQKTIMGQKTNIKLVFSAVNPPSEYASGYMDLALASRFVTFQVPDARPGMLTEGEIEDIIINGNALRGKVDPFEIKSAIEQVRVTQFSKGDIEHAAGIVRKLVTQLNQTGVMWSIRQARSCLKMLLQMEAFKVTGLFTPSMEDFASLVIATIPEVQGITRKVAERPAIESVVRSLFVAFELKDPLVVARGLDELIEAEVRDQLAWATAVVTATNQESNIIKINDAIKSIKKRAKGNSLELDVATKVVKSLAIKKTILETQKLNEEFSLASLEEHIERVKNAA